MCECAVEEAGWTARSVNAGASLFYARICYGSASSSPTERLLSRADVSVASRYNLAGDKTGLYNSLWRGLGVTGVESSAGPIGAGVNFTSATDLHIGSVSTARDVVADV